MKLYIKNMVCNRCIMVVGDILNKTGLKPTSISLGQATLNPEPTAEQLIRLQKNLAEVGFEILTDQKHQIIEKIKNAVIRHIRQDNPENNHNFSVILSKALNKDYSYLSKLFSEAEGITIEKYIIDQKTERVKELLVYEELNLSEIAFQLGYSSSAHLSAQFKKVTGFTPSAFRKLKDHHRKPLDKR